MNNRSFAWSILILWVLSALGLMANDSVKFPTGPAAWTVDVVTSQNSKSPRALGGSQVAKVEVTQSDKICRNVVFCFNGASRTTWSIPGSSLIMTEDPNGTAFLTPTNRLFNVPYLPSVFDWVGPVALQEKTPIYYQSKLVFHYKSSSTEAWVESKTLLPVAIDDGVGLATFTFHPPPTEALELPAKYKTILDHYTLFMGSPQTQAPAK